MNIKEIEIYTVFNNINPNNNSCKSLWGFSAIIKTNNKKILFDTGSNGRVLIENLKTIDINPLDIDTIFISHGHWDHIGGLDSIVELNNKIDLYVTKHLSKNFINDYKTLTRRVTTVEDSFYKISEDIYSTGPVGNAKEQSLIIDTNKGLIIVFGCAHSGTEIIAKMAQEHFKKDILLLLGGFHLSDKNEKEISNVIDLFKESGIKYISPSHCTGDLACSLFEKYMDDSYIRGGVGQKIKFEESGVLELF